jgi:hypothetical protein
MIVLRNAWSHSQSQSARPNHVLSRAYPQVGGLLGLAKLRIVRSEGGRLNVHRRTSASSGSPTMVVSVVLGEVASCDGLLNVKHRVTTERGQNADYLREAWLSA